MDRALVRMADLSQGFQRHVARADGPLVVLLEQDGADQAGDGRLVGEYSDDVGASLDLFVEALQGVGRVDLGPVIFGEGHEGQYVLLGRRHCLTAASWSCCSKAVRMAAATISRWPFGTWARAFLMKWTRGLFSNSGVGVKLSVKRLPGPLFSPRSGLGPPHDGIEGRRRINVENVLADCTASTMLRIKPRVSTRRWRYLPLIFLPAS